MTTEQKEKLRNIVFDIDVNAALQFVEQLEKQAAIDALAKAEKVKEISDELNGYTEEFDYHAKLGERCGTFATYLTNFTDQMTPDQREIIAIQFDQNLFGTDKAMAERFRNANNTSHENN